MPDRLFPRLFFRPLFGGRARRAPGLDAAALARRLRADAPPAAYAAADRARDFRAVFRATPAGRRVLAQLLGRCRVCARSHVPGDALETARREGMRDVGLWLLDILDEAADAPATAEGEPGATGGGDER